MAPCLLQQLLNELQQQQNDRGHQGCCCEDLQELKTVKRKKSPNLAQIQTDGRISGDFDGKWSRLQVERTQSHHRPG